MRSSGGRIILVTGGAGFIGSHLVESLLKRGEYVRVLDNFSTGKRENLEGFAHGNPKAAANFELMVGDIRDPGTLDRAAEGVEVILHQAALGSVPRSVEDPLTTQQVNADGTLTVLLAAREHHVGRVVYASSSAVYGDSQILPRKEGNEGKALSPYALTKQVNEEYGRLFHDLYGMETIGLRYFNVYGPRQDPASEYAAVIPRFVSALLSDRQPTVYGTGEQSRDFTYVQDVVKANTLAMDAPVDACGRAYNIGRGDQTTLLELLETLKGILKIDVSPRHEPPRTGDVMYSSADVSLARDMLGFTAACDLSQGLEQSIQWYRENL